MNSRDIWTLLAHEKFGPLPEGWRWTELRALGGDLPREKCISEITGCVVTEGPERFKSGSRKGQLKKKFDKTTERVFHVTFGDFDAFCEEWERKNDTCHGCWGEGTTPWKWSVENGEECRTCELRRERETARGGGKWHQSGTRTETRSGGEEKCLRISQRAQRDSNPRPSASKAVPPIS